MSMVIFFFNDTATTEIYTLSLHDALPIFSRRTSDDDDPSRHADHRHDLRVVREPHRAQAQQARGRHRVGELRHGRSEEHTSELQSRQYLVCRLLLEKKKKQPL